MLLAELEQLALPAHWRPAAALDGSLTYRTDAAGEQPAWLGGAAAPRARADGLLVGFQPGDYNPSLPEIAAGAELQLLLSRLPYYQAVYVFGTEFTSLAAVLRVCDLSSAISAGRCVFVPPGREEAFLREHLAAHPGLLHPGNIVVLPGVADERIQGLCRICERVARDVLQAARSTTERTARIDHRR